MYNNNGYPPQIRKVKSTPVIWVLRALLVLTYAGSGVGTIMQIYDSALYGMFGNLGGSGGMMALCIVAGIVLTAIRYGLFELLLRAGSNSLGRNFTYMGQVQPDPNYLYTVVGSCFIAANAVNTLFSLLSVFYASQLYVASAFIALVVKLLAMTAALLVLARKVGKENFTFVFSAMAPLFAVAVILL